MFGAVTYVGTSSAAPALVLCCRALDPRGRLEQLIPDAELPLERSVMKDLAGSGRAGKDANVRLGDLPVGKRIATRSRHALGRERKGAGSVIFLCVDAVDPGVGGLGCNSRCGP
jgi:hypothetical protein